MIVILGKLDENVEVKVTIRPRQTDATEAKLRTGYGEKTKKQ